jgi:hypothetical protein
MSRKTISIALFLAFLPFVAWAADSDKSTTAPAGDNPSGQSTGSFFQGVWVGEWSGFVDPQIRQDATVEIGAEVKKGVFKVTYSWGEATYRGKRMWPGKIKTEGSVKDDQLLFSWKNKMGRTFDMTLKKKSDDKIKARIERSGPLGPMESPYSETILTRK